MIVSFHFRLIHTFFGEFNLGEPHLKPCGDGGYVSGWTRGIRDYWRLAIEPNLFGKYPHWFEIACCWRMELLPRAVFIGPPIFALDRSQHEFEHA